MGGTPRRFNGRFKKIAGAGRRCVGEGGVLGLYGNDYINDHVNTGEVAMAKGQKRSNREAKKPKQAKTQKKGAATSGAATSPKK